MTHHSVPSSVVSQRLMSHHLAVGRGRGFHRERANRTAGYFNLKQTCTAIEWFPVENTRITYCATIQLDDLFTLRCLFFVLRLTRFFISNTKYIQATFSLTLQRAKLLPQSMMFEELRVYAQYVSAGQLISLTFAQLPKSKPIPPHSGA